MRSRPFFILEMANNHMGDPAHGEALIRAFAPVVGNFPEFAFGFKLQYRDLDSFIHPSARGRADVKYVKRFEETRLAADAFERLLATMRECGFVTVCTPFDEPSVDLIERQGIAVVKIASCSFTDWPLLERIARCDKPVVASTAGAALEDIDAVVSFFRHRDKELTLMHCVAEYPTPADGLALDRIDVLRRRYADVRVGYSTHENPDAVEPVMMAVAKGAAVFEKHVALPDERYAAHAYSATPAQVHAWLNAARRAYAICGGGRCEPSPAERDSLRSLRRGVYARRDIAAGETLDAAAVEFAFPPVDGQITANEWSKYQALTTRRTLAAGEPIRHDAVDACDVRGPVRHAVKAVKKLLRQGNIVVPGRSELELSHHYGMENFDRYGLTMITVVNREYCKKLLVMLPGQAHPEQYHKQKEETFVILHGAMRLWLDDVEQECRPGDVVTVHRNVRHRFHTDAGVVFEEISSTHYTDDSYYADPAVAANAERKTRLAYWMNA